MPDAAVSSSRAGEKYTLPTQIFIGNETCKKLWHDMSSTLLPSWVTTVPKHVGNHKHRKLSANQWKVLVTLHLPATLIPLWINREGVFPMLVENLIDLVKVVRFAASHVVSQDLVTAYNAAIERYLNGMCTLFPQATITPTQHAATHFGRFLEDFGPSREYDCFPYEGMNHQCQLVPTNRRAGKYFDITLQIL